MRTGRRRARTPRARGPTGSGRCFCRAETRSRRVSRRRRRLHELLGAGNQRRAELARRRVRLVLQAQDFALLRQRAELLQLHGRVRQGGREGTTGGLHPRSRRRRRRRQARRLRLLARLLDFLLRLLELRLELLRVALGVLGAPLELLLLRALRALRDHGRPHRRRTRGLGSASRLRFALVFASVAAAASGLSRDAILALSAAASVLGATRAAAEGGARASSSSGACILSRCSKCAVKAAS